VVVRSSPKDTGDRATVHLYEGRSTNKLQNSIILLVFQI